MIDEPLRAELLAMARADHELRALLVADGTLFQGYHPRMAALHGAHAERLAAIIDAHGWPRARAVGSDGVASAWLVVQHAIGHPTFMRRCQPLVAEAVARGEITAADHARLIDRIRIFEGRPQLYGTHVDWDERGELSALPIDDLAGLEARRAAVGLPPLRAEIERLRRRAEQEGDRPPADARQRREESERWARSVGWRDI